MLVCVAALVGNLVGSVAFAAGRARQRDVQLGPGAELVASTVAAKDALAGPQLFWRAVLCNALVCLGLWMAARTKSDAAKLVVLWWALLAFIASGFEHSVANMTTFALARSRGRATGRCWAATCCGRCPATWSAGHCSSVPATPGSATSARPAETPRTSSDSGTEVELGVTAPVLVDQVSVG